MRRRRQPAIAVFFLIQIILLITTSDSAPTFPRLSSSSSVRLRRGVQSFEPQSRLASHQQDHFSFLTDHRATLGRDGRPLFGALNLRSTANFQPDDENRYWDFVLGSGIFKRDGGDDWMSKRASSGRGRVRRADTSTGSLSPVFDVLGRRLKDKDESQTTPEGACDDDGKNVQSLRDVKKKTNDKTVRSFDENQDFFDFLLGEQGF